MSQRQKNMVMIMAAQINITVNEDTAAGVGAATQKQRQSNGTSAVSTIRTGSFIGAGDEFHNAEGIRLGYGSFLRKTFLYLPCF